MGEASQKPEVTLAVADPLCGRVLNGRFSILEPLGAGGMGKVYKAIQAPLDRMVAVKVLHPHFSNNRDPGFVKRFVLEASTTSKLRHPNTVTVIDYGQTEDGIFYIAMEYLEGLPLSEVLAKQGALPWQRALHIGQQVCRSLREAHKFGIIHRDLKPANVMLLDEADNDLVKVLDFGLVKSFVGEGGPGEQPDSKITQAGVLLGSPQYMSPEQARNHSDQRSDIYSFGVLLYEMMTGKPPFTARDYLEVIVKHLKEPPPPFRLARPDLAIPPEVEDLVFRCLEKDPAHRFQSMDEVLDALRACGATGNVATSFPDGQPLSGAPTHQSGSRPGLPTGIAGATPPPIALHQRDITPRPGAPLPYTPPPVAPGTPPPFAPPHASATGSSPGIGRTGSRPGVAVIPPQQPPPSQSAPRMFQGSFPSPEEPPAEEPAPAAGLFAAQQQQGGGKAVYIIGALVLALLAGGGYLYLGRSKPADPATQSAPGQADKPKEGTASTPAVAAAPAGAAGKAVRFRVATEPPGAQVFMGAKMMGETPVTFEAPAQADGTALVDLVLVLDGYYPLPITAGGSGDVLISQRLQRKGGGAAASSRPAASGPGPGGPRGAASARPDAPAVAPPPEPEVEELPVIIEPPPAFDGPSRPAEPARPAPAPVAAAPAETGAEVIPFGEGMSRPEQLQAGKPIQYTREALTAKVEGLMIVKCVINTRGQVERCRVIKSLPYMEDAALEHLTSRLYKPVTYQGKPVAVEYVFDIRLVLPRR
jgi:serine/threonine-protein kinase